MPRSPIVAVLACAVLALGAVSAVAQESGGTTARAAGPSLATGATGARVAALQGALGIEADGHFGPATRRAVRRFQRAHDLPVTGVADGATLAALGVDAQAAMPAPDAGSALAQIARCESGGNPAAVSRDGRYRGKYQFTRATWRALGGTGDPAQAPEAEQDRRAAELFAREGAAPWPSCGQGIE